PAARRGHGGDVAAPDHLRHAEGGGRGGGRPRRHPGGGGPAHRPVLLPGALLRGQRQDDRTAGRGKALAVVLVFQSSPTPAECSTTAEAPLKAPDKKQGGFAARPPPQRCGGCWFLPAKLVPPNPGRAA